jgi:hypothetical protein
VRLAAFLLAGLCALLLSSCGNTVQEKPISHTLLEDLIVSPFPVYWMGNTLEGQSVTEVTHDYSDSFSVEYGTCLHGGEGTCVTPLRIVTSPDNSFLPGGSGSTHRRLIRGSQAVVAQGGKALIIPTGPVVVDIYADSPALAQAAARIMVPINEPGAPEAPLPAQLPDTGFGATPLPAQAPDPLRQLG